jgi:predicted N-acyltransferase
MAELELLSGVAEVPREEWNALVGDESPFLEWDWLAMLEEAELLDPSSGWAPQPLVIREAGKVVAACPLYLKGNSEGEFVFDWGWADAAHRAGIDYYPKLLVGIPFTPVTGGRFLVAKSANRAAWCSTLARALRELCVANELSSVHVNFCREDEFDALIAAGFMPRLGLQYHWHNAGYRVFDDYLAHMRSKRRNQTRREMRAMQAEGIRIESFVGDAIRDEWVEPMFRFYLETIRSRPWGRQYLNRRFFERITERFRERLCFVVATQGDTPIAGTFNVQKGDALYGRYWGAARPVRYLHFNVCYYAAIDHCIRAGLQRFEPGAGGEYKQLRGFDARPTRSAHFVRDPRLAEAVSGFLERERGEVDETIDWLQERSALKRAPEEG